MSDEDPWKNWYQAERPPGGEAGSDATRDMTVSSRMPPPPGSGQGGSAGGSPWPQQPPRVSSPGTPGSQPGGGKVMMCLKSHKDQVSAGCKTAFEHLRDVRRGA